MPTKVDVPKPNAIKRLFALETDISEEISSGRHSDAVIAHLCNVLKCIGSIRDAQDTAEKMVTRARG